MMGCWEVLDGRGALCAEYAATLRRAPVGYALAGWNFTVRPARWRSELARTTVWCAPTASEFRHMAPRRPGSGLIRRARLRDPARG